MDVLSIIAIALTATSVLFLCYSLLTFALQRRRDIIGQDQRNKLGDLLYKLSEPSDSSMAPYRRIVNTNREQLFETGRLVEQYEHDLKYGDTSKYLDTTEPLDQIRKNLEEINERISFIIEPLQKNLSTIMDNVNNNKEFEYSDILTENHKNNRLQSLVSFFVSISFYLFAFALLLIAVIQFSQNGNASIITSIASTLGSIMSGGVGTSLLKIFMRLKAESSEYTKIATKQNELLLKIKAAKAYISDEKTFNATVTKLLLENDTISDSTTKSI